MKRYRDWRERLAKAQWPMTAEQITETVGKGMPSDVVAAIRAAGFPLKIVGRVPGQRGRYYRKLYAIDEIKPGHRAIQSPVEEGD